MDKIKIMLVDDHEVMRSGLRMLLESQDDMQIITEANSGQQALNTLQEQVPDVVVIDITLPDISGIQVTRQIKQIFPDLPVVALTIHDDEQHFFEMLQAGASGYVPKKAASENLIHAIRSACQGQIYLHPAVAKLLVEDYKDHTEEETGPNSLDVLTARENQVLKLLAEGHSNQQIADELVISKHTVARHRENIMRKLNLHSRSDLVKFAIKKGVIAP